MTDPAALYALAAASGLGFTAAIGFAIYAIATTRSNARLTVELRDARTETKQADAGRLAAESVKAADAATIVRLKAQVAKLQKERNEHAEANAQRGADGGGDAALRSIRELYPDADSDG